MSVWVFGYGSLVWRPAFPFLERVPARLRGWQRRFWQHSPDHRGTPALPGRVVTLLARPEADVIGVAFRIATDVAEAVLPALDHREKAGYERHMVVLNALGDGRTIDAMVYVAGPQNGDYAGPATIAEIADRVVTAHGPSGANTEYVLRLDEALEALGQPDDHVRAIAGAVRDRVATSRQ